MKSISIIILFLISHSYCFSQRFLGHNKEELLLTYAKCGVTSNYKEMVVLNCDGKRSVYYFKGENGPCDLYATETDTQSAADTLNYILKHGFSLLETRYVEPFLISKHNNHQKFPSKVYTDGKVEYCFLPVSLTGRTAEWSSIIVRYKK